MRLLQFVLRSLERVVRALQILLRPLAIGLRALEFLLSALAFALRTLQILVRRLTVGVRTLSIRLRTFNVGLCTLQIGLCTLAVRMCAFEIRLCASAFGRDGFFEFTPRLRSRLRRGLFGLRPRAGDRFGQRAIDVGARSRDFRLEARPPLRLNLVQSGRPALFRVRFSPLTRLLKRLLMTLRQIAQVSIELCLQFGANPVNDTSNLFLGH